MVNLLISYAYWKPEITELLYQEKGRYRLIVDSGAYTAWNLGKTIALDDYCRFLDSIQHLHPFQAVQLDVIGDPDKTLRNLEIMFQRGYQVMPVFTRGDDLKILDWMYQHTKTVMTGGIVKGNATKNYLKWLHSVNHNRPVHWLGFADLSFIRVFMPTSVDSSVWSSAVRYGELGLFLDGKMKRIHKKSFAVPPPRPVMQAILDLGIPATAIRDLGISGNWRNFTQGHPFVLRGVGLHRTINALSWVKFCQMTESRFNTHFYLVCVAPSDIQLLLKADSYLVSH